LQGRWLTFTVDVGATYAATTTALASGQIDGGFLTASGYAQESIENPGKVDVLLSASRAGYKVQADDFPGFDDAAKAKQLAAMNGEIGADGNAVTRPPIRLIPIAAINPRPKSPIIRASSSPFAIRLATAL
jgi:hypothetical protein